MMMAMAMLLGGWELLLLGAVALVLAPLCLLAFVFWVWMLLDCIRNEKLDEIEKIVWVLVIALTHFLGAAIYYFAARRNMAESRIG